MTAPAAVAEHRYVPRGTALEVMHRRDPELLVSGPAGTGKSRACLEKVHLMCLVNPGMRALLLRKTLVSLTSTGLVTWREHVAPESLAIGESEWYGGSQAEPPQYRYVNGSKVMIGGMDKPEKVMSSEYDVIYVQEATELAIEDWEACNSRLRNGRVSFQQLLADCNPSAPTHWLKQRCDSGATTMINSRHEDNPRLFNVDGALTEQGATYMRRLDALTGVRKLRLRHGLWVAAEGLVYEGWNEDLHLRPAFSAGGRPTSPTNGRARVPKHWPRYWSIDFGYTNPFVLQCWAQDDDGRLILYREIYHTKRLVEDHCETIAKIVMRNPTRTVDADGRPGPWQGEWVEPMPEAIICDHDAEGRATFERHMGMTTVAAHKAVTEGIEAVQARLEPAGDGRARIQLCRDAVVERDQDLTDAMRPASTIEEITGYVWDQKPDKPPKEEPVKENDHGMDAMRYMAAYKDLRGEYRLRWV